MITQPIRAKYTDGVLRLLGKIGLSEGEEVLIRVETKDETPAIDDSQIWLEANMTEKLPPYEWGKEGTPKTSPVRYSRDKGFYIDDQD